MPETPPQSDRGATPPDAAPSESVSPKSHPSEPAKSQPVTSEPVPESAPADASETAVTRPGAPAPSTPSAGLPSAGAQSAVASSPLADLPGPARAALSRLLSDRAGPGDAAQAALAAEGWTRGAEALDPGRALLLATDIGGTKAQTALCDLDGTVLAETKAPTDASGGLALIDQILTQRDLLLKELDVAPARIAAAGVGLPASIDPATGRLHRGPNIADLERHDLVRLFGEALSVPAAVENDVNMAALGEHWRGAPGGAETSVFVAIGTGIGMGTVVRGELLRGAHGAAGEIAALPIGADPFDPATFRQGALESAISSAAMLRDYRARGGTAQGTLKDLFAIGADPAFDAVIDRLATCVAQAILSICSILDPGCVVLGGSVGSRPDLLARLEAKLALCMPDSPDCRISTLGNRAGVVGAARAARLRLAGTLAAESS
ncbi:ROK family protein [Mesobaculum littorinae]|uniref:ROK family protein n=1 Tax=Mesobaculum littorinae TaxID=2486419 RepID=A0A438AFR9_9RHOB|nr:ROK family protein [Mesobaculum littorinae]RVV97563.1 ROK family protein [Mesobaculum littorinae]